MEILLNPCQALSSLMYSLVPETYADIVAHLLAGATGCVS
jgi:hypothetical protein